jgi:polycystin 1L2
VCRPLGPLNFIRLFHDNSGKGSYASWYCKFVAIYDLQTKEKFIFMVDRWFAVEEDDGQVDRLIPVAGPEQMTQFTHMFTSRTRQQLSDEHLWFSIVARPTLSVFSRMERLSCCLCLLFTSMIANMLFYQRTDDSASTGLDIGPFSLSPEQVRLFHLFHLYASSDVRVAAMF